MTDASDHDELVRLAGPGRGTSQEVLTPLWPQQPDAEHAPHRSAEARCTDR